MKKLQKIRSRFSAGFTLVEMAVIAPIVILLIGGFIALIVNLTGEVMSSRGSNMLTYNIQDALNRIEQDVKLSTTFLSVNNISINGTGQGYGSTTTAGTNINFTNVDKSSSSGSTASLILNTLVTDGNPLSTTSGLIYLKDQPNPCTTASEYSKNRPMSANVVYFVDSNNTLWRRVIMPSNYNNSSVYCGSAPWQIPTCVTGYVSASLPFCATGDEKLVDGVSPSDFDFKYYTSAGSTSESTTATNPSLSDDARNTALLATPTLGVTITANQTVAGRDISRSASLRTTRLDSNASSIVKDTVVSSAPAAPVPKAVISDGHVVTVTWPQVATATTYEASYQINGGSWLGNIATIGNTARSYVTSAGDHTDTVAVRVRATNAAGSSSYATTSIVIPLWAPLNLKLGWTDYGNGYSTAAYTKTKAGYVMVKGLVRKTATPTTGETLAILPPDYRPAEGALIIGTTTSPNTWGRVDIWPGGEITMSGGSNAWFSLETIRFVASTETYTRTPTTFLNGWVNYAPAAWARASYTQDSAGRVNLQGLISSGTMADNTTVSSLPVALAPPQYLHISTHASGSGYSLIGVSVSPGVIAKGVGTNGYYSITSSYIPASTGVTWTTMTLQNSWVVYPGYSSPQYTKTNDNVVHLKGLIRLGTNSDGTIITTLPATFRPKERIISTGGSLATHTRIDIHPGGEITIHGSDSNGWLSLDGISFYGEW